MMVGIFDCQSQEWGFRSMPVLKVLFTFEDLNVMHLFSRSFFSLSYPAPKLQACCAERSLFCMLCNFLTVYWISLHQSAISNRLMRYKECFCWGPKRTSTCI